MACHRDAGCAHVVHGADPNLHPVAPRRALTRLRMERPSAAGEGTMSDWKIQLRGTCKRCGGAGRVEDPKSGRLLDCHPCDSTGEVHPFVPLAELKALLNGI